MGTDINVSKRLFLSIQGNGRSQEFQGGYSAVAGQTQAAASYPGGPMMNAYEMQSSSYRTPIHPPPPTYSNMPRGAMGQVRSVRAGFHRAPANTGIVSYPKAQQPQMMGGDVRMAGRPMQQGVGGRQAGGGVYQTPMECAFDPQQHDPHNQLIYDPNNTGTMIYQ